MIHSKKQSRLSPLNTAIMSYELVWVILFLGTFLNGLKNDSVIITLRDTLATVIMIVINHLFLHQAVPVKPAVPLHRQMTLFGIHLFFLARFIFILTQPHGNILTAFIVAASAAVFEEYMLRGLVFGSLLAGASNNYRRIMKAVLISALLFSLTHLINLSGQSFYVTSQQIIQSFGMGFICCALYLRSGSIFLPILLHFLLDFTVLCMNNSLAITGHVNPASTLVVTACYLTIGMVLLREKKMPQFHLLEQL